MKTKMRILSIIISLAMLVGMLPFYTFAATEHPEIIAGKEVFVDLDGELTTAATYKFVPEKDGIYVIYSYDNDNDPYCVLYDSNMEELDIDDDDGTTNNFRLEYSFTAGDTYYITGRLYSTTSTGSYKMIVEEGVRATGIEITDDTSQAFDSITLFETKREYLYNMFIPQNAISESVEWTTDNDDVVHVNSGTITAVKPGNATVTATTESGISDSVVVNVLPATELKENDEFIVSESNSHNREILFRFTPQETTLYSVYTTSDSYGDIHLELSYFDEYGNKQSEYDLDYETENGNKRIDYTFNEGVTYYIFAHHYASDDFVYTVNLIAPVEATEMKLSPDTYSATYGTMLQLWSIFLPEKTAIPESVTYDSSDDSIASVDENGQVTLNKVGNATITATSSSGLIAECKITVTDIPVILADQVQNVNIINAGDSATFKFIPEEDGVYIFSSAGGYDTYGCILDANRNVLTANDGNTDFTCDYELIAGTVYLLNAKLYNNSITGSFTVSVTKHDHTFVYSYNEDSHYGSCNPCGRYYEEEHSFTDDVCICGYFKHDHVFNWYEIVDDVEHVTECIICLSEFYQRHKLDTDGVCDCGYFEHTHEYEFTSGHNESMHFVECTVCKSEEMFFHEFDAFGICSCGYEYHIHEGRNFGKDAYCHYGICDICGTYFDYAEHRYNEDGICTCGASDHEHANIKYVIVDTNEHNTVCEDCGVILDTIGHDYDDSGLCICGHSTAYLYESCIYIGDDTILCDGQYLAEDGTVTDTEPVEWVAHFADMVLTLKDMDIHSETAGICCEYTDDTLEIAVDGNVNITSENNEGIILYRGDLLISGTGSLNIVTGGDCEGILADENGDVTIEGDLRITIDAADSGIYAEETFTMNGGSLVITAGDEGIDAEDVEINDGFLFIHAENDCIDTDDNIDIYSGYFNLKAGSSGFEANENINILGGSIIIDAGSYGMQAGVEGDPLGYSTLTISGGYIRISADEAALCTIAPVTIAGNMGTVEMEQHDYCYYSMNGDEILTELVLPEDPDSGITASLSTDIGYYNGTNQDPVITVTDSEGNTLTNGTDYTVKWSDNEIIDRGIYVATITGVGKYEGLTEIAVFVVYDPIIYIGGVAMHNGDYLASGADNVTDTKPEGGYAYFNNGVLELSSFVYEGSGYKYNSSYSSAIYSNDVLNIVLKGKSSVCNTMSNSDVITANSGIFISGNGTITLSGDYGIYCIFGNIEINEGTIISQNSFDSLNAMKVIINGGNIDLDSDYPIYSTIAEIHGGTVKLTAGHTALNGDSAVIIDGGLTNIEATKGINGNKIQINGGYVKISALRRAIVAEMDEEPGKIITDDDVFFIIPDPADIRIVNTSCNIFDADGLLASKVVISDNNYGDANADGKVTLADVTLLLQHIAAWNVSVNDITADANADGSINLNDVTLLLQYIAGWNVSLG